MEYLCISLLLLLLLLLVLLNFLALTSFFFLAFSERASSHGTSIDIIRYDKL